MNKIESRYMMATTALHQTGDISRTSSDVCLIYGEEGNEYVGRWLTGPGFFDVRFPKATTRELTDKEKAEYNGMTLEVGGRIAGIVNIPDAENAVSVPTSQFVVKTRNSTYRFGVADADGKRSVTRDGRPFDCTECRIVKLIIGQSMILVDENNSAWQTSAVISVNATPQCSHEK